MCDFPSLSGLSKADCPAGNSNPVADSVLHHLKLHSATSRITSALTVTAWLHAAQAGTILLQPVPSKPAASLPQDIVQTLFACLSDQAVLVTPEGGVQPYTELTAMYSAMQQQAQVHC